MPDVLRCQLPGCGKALVGQQQKYCSRQHKKRAGNVRLNATPTGFVCKAPGCGVALMGRQKKYCVAHVGYANSLALRAFGQSARGKRWLKSTKRQRVGVFSAHTRRYRSLAISESVDLDDPEVRAQLDRQIHENIKLAGLARRLKHGPLLECPRCHGYKTERNGSDRYGKQRGYCVHCQREWTIGKDYARVACVHCGSKDTKRRGYNKSGTAIRKCMACMRQWTIGKDYGTPFPPAMVDLLHTARQTTLTPEEEAQVADILGSAHAEPACDAAHVV